MEAVSALLALCTGNLPITDEFPFYRASYLDVDVSLIWGQYNLLNKQSNDR